jgi:hypothetical protein
MSVTEYLNRARDCAAIADRTSNAEDKKKLLEPAETWGDLARSDAVKASAPKRPVQYDGRAR